MTWTHGTSAQANGTSAVPSIPKPGGFANGQLLLAVLSTDNPVTVGPPGWICDGRALSDHPTYYSWWHRVAANEATSYAWACASGNWAILLESFNQSGSLDQLDCADNYQFTKVAATATTLPLARPFETFSGDLIFYAADSFTSNTVAWPAGVTALQAVGGFADGWEVLATNGQTTARTITYSATSNNRIGITTAYASLAPVAAVVHTLSGSGQVSIASPVAIDIALSGLAGSLGTGKGNPVRYFQLGNIAWGTSLGFGRNYYLEHANEIVVAPFATCTLLAYSFAPGITATITEHLSI